MLGEHVGASRAALRAPARRASALDPAALAERRALMPSGARCAHLPGDRPTGQCHLYFARRVPFLPCADIGPATGDRSLAAHLPGVSIDRCDTTAIELAEFGQIGDQGVRGDISDARN